MDSPWQGGRALISVLALAQLLAPVKPTSAVGARAPAFAMPLGVRAPSMQGRVPSACPLRCASESGIAMREEKGSEEETETCVFEAVEQSSWVMVLFGAKVGMHLLACAWLTLCARHRARE